MRQENRVNSADFYKDGSLFITGADDETMHLYDTTSGTYVLPNSLLHPNPIAISTSIQLD
jgi:WD40 repeat protein